MIKNRVELHLHIDGSVSPLTVYEIARIEQIEPECKMSLEEIAASMIMADGDRDPEFLTFEPPIRCMQSAYGLSRVTRELVAKLEQQNVVYAELRFAPQLHLRKGLTQREVVQAALNGLQEGLTQADRIHAQIILCAMNFGPAKDYLDANLETVRLCKEFLDHGVCAVDLAGFESNLGDYKEVFDLAAQLGVPATCHTNLTVETALGFHTVRIGHGYTTVNSEALIEKARMQQVVYEMCPQSSISYCGFEATQQHPLRKLFDAGIKVAVCTDNLTVLNTDLDHEYELCRQMGFNDNELREMNRMAAEGAFLPEQEKQKLLAVLASEEGSHVR